ncbi:MAG: Fe-S protein assembly co-chaperone HscB [Phycisphaerales bacterium]|nr:Fe-S protein assembly co-chaperone HscB [Phycisphaerales bacterium]
MVVNPKNASGDTAALLKCRACDGPMETPVFCADCRRLYPADGVSYFELMGLAPVAEIAEEELRERYLKLSRGIHPDRQGAVGESVLGLRVSARLNEAYRVLSDPFLRIEYLLELAGGKSSAEDRSVPTDVLTESLGMREELGEARAAGDAARLEACRAQAQAQRRGLLVRLLDLARRLPGDAALRDELRKTLNASKYYQKILAET